jgi:hypothetical protein
MHSEPFMLACQSILAANFLFLHKFHSFLRKFRTDKQSMLLSVFKHFRRFCWEGGTDYRVMCCIALQKKKGGGPLFSPSAVLMWCIRRPLIFNSLVLLVGTHGTISFYYKCICLYYFRNFLFRVFFKLITIKIHN